MMAERRVLEVVNHPFIVKLHFAFQTHDKLRLVLHCNSQIRVCVCVCRLSTILSLSSYISPSKRTISCVWSSTLSMVESSLVILPKKRCSPRNVRGSTRLSSSWPSSICTVYLCVCMYTRIYPLYMHTHLCMCITSIYLSICLYTYIHTHTHTSVYVCVCVCVCVCMYIYTHTHRERACARERERERERAREREKRTYTTGTSNLKMFP